MVEPAASRPAATLPQALSPIVAGLWRSAEWRQTTAERTQWIQQALEMGITSFDHADIYGQGRAEELFGEALRAVPGLRNRLQLVTKCGIRLPSAAEHVHLKHYDTSPAYVRRRVEASLRHFGTDRLDRVLIHRPDVLMDAAELAETFAALTREGKVLQWGVSNHSPAAFALLHARYPLVTNQVEWSPLALAVLHDGTLDQAQQLGARPMIWSPLAGGRLLRGEDEMAQRVRAAMQPVADRLGVSLPTLAYAWILRHPSRPHPITGSGRIEGLREAVAALDLRLDAEDWYAIWTAAAGRAVP